MPGVKEPALDEIVLRLRGEFITDAEDRLTRMADHLSALSEGAEGGADALRQIRQEAHNLKGMGGTYGFPLITVVSHCLEDYLSGLDGLIDDDVAPVHRFLDVMHDILAGGYNDSDDHGSKLVRDLPVRTSADFEVIDPIPVEVLLVTPTNAVSRHIEAELRACGYRVIQVRSSFEAIEFAVRTRPDLIIVSGLLDELNGADVTRVLAVIEKTREIPVALVTSFARDHPELAGLASRTAIVRKDAHLSDDLAVAITGLGLADTEAAPPA
jgi:CheY-like chemotaxis protein